MWHIQPAKGPAATVTSSLTYTNMLLYPFQVNLASCGSLDELYTRFPLVRTLRDACTHRTDG